MDVKATEQSCLLLLQWLQCEGVWVQQVGTALSGWPTFEQGRPDLTSRWSALTIMELAALILILAAGKMALLCFSLDFQKDEDFQFEKC